MRGEIGAFVRCDENFNNEIDGRDGREALDRKMVAQGLQICTREKSRCIE